MSELFSEIYEKAYQQGRMAMLGGQGRYQNPYANVLDRGAWEDGYDDAAIEKLEAEDHGKIRAAFSAD